MYRLSKKRPTRTEKGGLREVLARVLVERNEGWMEYTFGGLDRWRNRVCLGVCLGSTWWVDVVG